MASSAVLALWIVVVASVVAERDIGDVTTVAMGSTAIDSVGAAAVVVVGENCLLYGSVVPSAKVTRLRLRFVGVVVATRTGSMATSEGYVVAMSASRERGSAMLEGGEQRHCQCVVNGVFQLKSCSDSTLS